MRGAAKPSGPAALLTLLFLACGEEGPEPGRLASEPAPAPATGSIRGTVHHPGPDPDRAVDMTEHPLCREAYDEPPLTEEVVVDADGGLANVFVRLEPEASALEPAPGRPAVLALEDCFFRPRVIGVRPGQPLRFENRDPTLHAVRIEPPGAEPLELELPFEGQSHQHTFGREEVMVPVTCPMHAWERAWVGVVDHPHFTVSQRGGGFLLDGVPPGLHRLTAWHERLGTMTEAVTVAVGEEARIDLVYPPRGLAEGRVD